MEALKTLKVRVETLKSKEDEKKNENNANKANEPPAKMSKNSEENAKQKWKDSLVMFLHTLNLLIGMCENALSSTTKEQKPEMEKPDEETGKDEKPDEKPPVEAKIEDEKKSDEDETNDKS